MEMCCGIVYIITQRKLFHYLFVNPNLLVTLLKRKYNLLYLYIIYVCFYLSMYDPCVKTYNTQTQACTCTHTHTLTVKAVLCETNFLTFK